MSLIHIDHRHVKLDSECLVAALALYWSAEIAINSSSWVQMPWCYTTIVAMFVINHSQLSTSKKYRGDDLGFCRQVVAVVGNSEADSR